MEQFDEYMVVLSEILGYPLEDFTYFKWKVVKDRPKVEEHDVKFLHQLEELTQMDKFVYDSVVAKFENIKQVVPNFNEKLKKLKTLQYEREQNEAECDGRKQVVGKGIDCLFLNRYQDLEVIDKKDV